MRYLENLVGEEYTRVYGTCVDINPELKKKKIAHIKSILDAFSKIDQPCESDELIVFLRRALLTLMISDGEKLVSNKVFQNWLHNFKEEMKTRFQVRDLQEDPSHVGRVLAISGGKLRNKNYRSRARNISETIKILGLDLEVLSMSSLLPTHKEFTECDNSIFSKVFGIWKIRMFYFSKDLLISLTRCEYIWNIWTEREEAVGVKPQLPLLNGECLQMMLPSAEVVLFSYDSRFLYELSRWDDCTRFMFLGKFSQLPFRPVDASEDFSFFCVPCESKETTESHYSNFSESYIPCSTPRSNTYSISECSFTDVRTDQSYFSREQIGCSFTPTDPETYQHDPYSTSP